MQGIENLADDENLLDSLSVWKNILGEEKILIVRKDLLDNLEDDGEIDSVLGKNKLYLYQMVSILISSFLASTDLIDVRLTAWNDSADLGSQIERSLSGPLSPERGAWIHWTLGYAHSNVYSDDGSANIPSSILPRNATLSTTLMQMMLPGKSDSLSIFNLFDVIYYHLSCNFITCVIHLPIFLKYNTISK